jgi:predicted NAD/FAD-binding protein
MEEEEDDVNDDITAISSSKPLSLEDLQVDIAIVGAGIGGLSAGAILNTLYGKKVGIFESHYLAGGCAHAFERKAAVTVGVDNDDNNNNNNQSQSLLTFTFDSGPTILLG